MKTDPCWLLVQADPGVDLIAATSTPELPLSVALRITIHNAPEAVARAIAILVGERLMHDGMVMLVPDPGCESCVRFVPEIYQSPLVMVFGKRTRPGSDPPPTNPEGTT